MTHITWTKGSFIDVRGTCVLQMVWSGLLFLLFKTMLIGAVGYTHFEKSCGINICRTTSRPISAYYHHTKSVVIFSQSSPPCVDVSRHLLFASFVPEIKNTIFRAANMKPLLQWHLAATFSIQHFHHLGYISISLNPTYHLPPPTYHLDCIIISPSPIYHRLQAS